MLLAIDAGNTNIVFAVYDGKEVRAEWRAVTETTRTADEYAVLLQPLMENAVRHGIQPLREGGSVLLRGQRDGNGIRIEISNPLPGTPPAPGNGHGLDSVRRRIAYRYGPHAKVQAGPQGDRFVVLLQLPGASA